LVTRNYCLHRRAVILAIAGEFVLRLQQNDGLVVL
jgi:hypothetical protein